MVYCTQFNVQSGEGLTFMGVVYKFKKEVIDFVLQQKRTDHDLGCRQLATLTSEKFKIQVSKSSVNAIIKNASLSNAVGRPLSIEPSPKKFQIPSQKKQQLLEDVQKIKLKQNPLSPSVLPPPRKDPALSGPKNEPGLSPPRKVPVAGPQGQGFSQTVFLRQIEDLRARRRQAKGVVLEGMGCVFLKAAQWQLSKTSILGGLLRKYIQEPLPAQFDAFCDVLPCLDFLGEHGPTRSGRLINHALWSLNGFAQPLSEPEISRWENIVQALPPSVKFTLEYEKEKQQVFMEAKRFKFYLENGKQAAADACLAGFGEGNLPTGFSACAHQAMTLLSHCVISNNHPAIFLSSEEQQFSQRVLDMMAAFEGTEGKQFQKVAVFDGTGERIAEFFSFPRKKRFFMLGVWPWQEEFSLLSSTLSKNVKTVEPFYDEVTDKIFYVAAGPATAFQKERRSKEAPLRSITVLPSPESTPVMVILTNCADKAPTDIVAAFLRRWPNLDTGPAGKALQGAPFLPTVSVPKDVPGAMWRAGQNPSLVFGDWGNVLNGYCQRHFLCGEFARIDATSLISILYSLSGYCVAQEQALLVSLCLPEAYSSLSELQQAVARINEADVADPLGRTLFINIV